MEKKNSNKIDAMVTSTFFVHSFRITINDYDLIKCVKKMYWMVKVNSNAFETNSN